MECLCDIEVDQPKVFRTKARTANRQHTCGECHQSILSGEIYINSSGLWDCWENHKTCHFCAAVNAARGGCPYFGGLAESLSDDLQEFGQEECEVHFGKETWQAIQDRLDIR